MRRVVVTGMGAVTPLGIGVEHVWKRLLAGESGIGAIQSFDVADLPAKIAGQIPQGTKADGRLDLNEWMPAKDQRKMDRFIALALVAAQEAVEDMRTRVDFVTRREFDSLRSEMAELRSQVERHMAYGSHHSHGGAGSTGGGTSGGTGTQPPGGAAGSGEGTGSPGL